MVSIALVLSIGVASHGEEHVFPGGTLISMWNADSLEIHVLLDAPWPSTNAATWVLTDVADRFEDGIFAWQLHCSRTQASMLVIPNDFLETRLLSLEQLGIAIDASEDLQDLAIRIPADGSIPRLVASGDRLRFHALWIQQPALVSFACSEEGSGPEALGSVAGAGGELAETREEPAADALPERVRYIQGEAVWRRFILADALTGEPRRGLGASYSLLRIREGLADEFVRFSHIVQDAGSGALEYSIDTAELQPGRYRLVIGFSCDGTSVSCEIEIIRPDGA